MTRYFINGYNKITGKLCYTSALSEDYKDLLKTMQMLHNEFGFILLIKVF